GGEPRGIRVPSVRAANRSIMRRGGGAVVIAAASVALLAGCIPSGPPTPEQLSEQFAEAIEPTWEVEVDGIFGEPVVRDGLVFSYAVDEADGMRLEARSLDDGAVVWEHVASPGGAYSNPVLQSGNSASRTYPFPSIRPLLLERAGDGDGAEKQSVVVFFERDIPETDEIQPSDLLHVVDARTGDPLEVTFEPYDEFDFRPYGTLDSGEVFANVLDPGRLCGPSTVCFTTNDADTSGSAMLSLDVDALTLEFTPTTFPERDETVIPEFGTGYATVITDESTLLARYDDGQVIWEVDFDVLYGESQLSPPDFIDFTEVGGLVLVQGYRPIVETLDRDLPHTLDLDFAASRILIALHPETGEVAWRVPGADLLCHVVHQFEIEDDATSVPACLATGGAWVYDLDTEEYLEQTDVEASIAGIELADGSIGWELPGLGENALAHVGRIGGPTFAGRGAFTVASSFDSLVEPGERTNGVPQLVDLATGKALPIEDDSDFVCKDEREDVELEFEGSIFAGGSNPITTGYPGGWYHLPCDADGVEGGGWTKGGVRVAGYQGTHDGRTYAVLTTEGGLVGFDLG
ncbi:MAG: hypothetical protein M3Y46_03565, partial [Actinomycetota bacterium]|nr:hypothetical protein [Actinomycetota bacterium]